MIPHSLYHNESRANTKKQWVVGFLFRNECEAALVMKTRPAWQAGKLNGVGGKVEEGETPLVAMRREFLEEAGVAIADWREYARLSVAAGEIYFFVAHGDHTIASMTDEEVGWYHIAALRELPVIENLRWLVPLALDRENKYTQADYRQ